MKNRTQNHNTFYRASYNYSMMPIIVLSFLAVVAVRESTIKAVAVDETESASSRTQHHIVLPTSEKVKGFIGERSEVFEIKLAMRGVPA